MVFSFWIHLTFFVLLAPLTQAQLCSKHFGVRAYPQLDWQKLTPDVQKKINRSIYEENLQLSPTITTGASSKTYSVSSERVQEISRQNAFKAYFKLEELALNKNITAEDLVMGFEKLNALFNDGIEAKTSGGAVGQAGEYRQYGYLPGDKGLSGPALQSHLKNQLLELARFALKEIQNPQITTAELAAAVHFQSAVVLKAFHDGNSRISRSWVDFIFLRRGEALPRLAQSHQNRVFGAYFDKRDSVADFQKYLEVGIQKSKELLEPMYNFDIDFSSPASRVVSIHRLLNNPESDKKARRVRLADGRTLELGLYVNQGTTAHVYCLNAACSEVIKIALNMTGILGLKDDIIRTERLKKLNIPVADIVEAGENYLIKKKIVGTPGEIVMEQGLTLAQIKGLADIHRVLSQHQVSVDHSAHNMFWSGQHWIFVEAAAFVHRADAADLNAWLLRPESWSYYWFSKRPSDYKRFLQLISPNPSIYNDNLFLSRTVNSGVSTKQFSVSVAEAKAIAQKNAENAFLTLVDLATSSQISPASLRLGLENLNWQFTQGMDSQIPGGASGKAGEYRQKAYFPQDLGLEGPALVQHLKQSLEKLNERVLLAMQNPQADVVKIAADAHYQLAAVIRPFHDGKGRTARAFVDFIFMKMNQPLPLYATDNLEAAFKEYMSVSGDRAAFEKYLATAAARSRTLSAENSF